MKLIALLSAAALTAGSLTVAAAPADAQHRGYNRYHGNYRGHHYAPRRQYRGYRGNYRARYGYRGARGYGRSRVVCRVHRGYYGPVRRCTRVYR